MDEREKWMRAALREARKAASRDEVPVGCVIVREGKILARAHNRREETQLATAHAELLAIQKACKKLGSWRLEGCDLYVTLEPCPMCAGAIVNARVGSVFFGAFDPKGGYAVTLHRTFEDPALNHRPAFEGGILEEECGELLRAYFREKRRQKTKERSV